MFVPFPGGINGRERELNNKQAADNRRNVGIERGLLGGLGDGLKSAEDHLTTLVEDVKQTTADVTGVVAGTEKGPSLVHDVAQVGEDGLSLVNDIATPVRDFVTKLIGGGDFASSTQSGNDNGNDNSHSQGSPITLPSLPVTLPTAVLPTLPTLIQPPTNDNPTSTVTNTPAQTGTQTPTGSSGSSGNGDRGSGDSGPVNGGGSQISNGGDAHQTTGATQSLPPVGGTNSVGENSGSSVRTSVPTNIAGTITGPGRGGMVAAAATPFPSPLFITSGSVTFIGTVIISSDASRGSYTTTSYNTYTPTDPSSPTSTSTQTDSSNPAALIGGIVVGVIAFLVLIITAVICLVRKRRTARKLSLTNPYPFSATDAAFSGRFEDSPPSTPRAGSFLTSSDLRPSRPSTAMELPNPRSMSFITRLLTPTERQSVVSRSEPDAFLSTSRRSSVSMGMAIGRWSSASTDTASFRTVPDTSEKDSNDHSRWSRGSDALSFHTTPDIDEEKSTVRGSFSSILGPLNSSPSLVVLKDPFADPEGRSLPYRDPSIVA
ncbi:hypothetical protein PQX77_010574 [Marasmius sp. AFHP31]|nr:hypothetical protein PQX77_010574 [Marasmius sp. AFHP31]